MKNSPTPKASFLNLSAGGGSVSGESLRSHGPIAPERGQINHLPLDDIQTAPVVSVVPEGVAELSPTSRMAERRGGVTRLAIRLGLAAALFLVTALSVIDYRNTTRLLETHPGSARYQKHALEEEVSSSAEAAELGEQTLIVTSAGGALAVCLLVGAFLVAERDLTRRTRVEAELRQHDDQATQLLQKLTESEARFRMVADQAPVMLYATDTDGQATYLSRPWLDFRGRTEMQELGFGWTDGIPDRDRAAIKQSVVESRKRRVSERLEFRVRRHDGALRWLLASSVPRYVSGEYVGHIGSAVDITDIKQAEEEMRLLVERQQKSESRLRQVSRQANCLLWEAQIQETVLSPGDELDALQQWHNQAARTTLGWDLSILDDQEAHRWLPVSWQTGEPFAPAFDSSRHPDDRARIDANSGNAIRNNDTGYRNEFRCKLADGNERWIAEDVRIEKLPNGSDGLGRWHLIGICTDITDRKRQEENLTRLTVELQRSNEALQDFASIASHDLREPLRKIQMFGGMLQKSVGATNDPTAERNIERVMGAATRMDALVRDLLAYSRVTSKAAPLALVDLNQIAAEVVADLEARLIETNGVVGFNGLPTVQADALQMRQLLQNLISNALKFHKKDQPPIVLVQGKREITTEGLFAVITVSDNGIGFEPEYAERVFNIFERLDSAREGYAGTGVGLAICRKIAQRHGGDVKADSLSGYGSVFTVRLHIPHGAA